MARRPLPGLAAAALALTPTPMPPTAAPPSTAALPPGLVWVDEGPAGPGSTLHAVDFEGHLFKRPLRYSLNAIACTPDGTIAGLATERDGARLPGSPHLVRVTTAGAVTDLGPAPGRPALATGYGAATVTAPDGSVQLLISTNDDGHGGDGHGGDGHGGKPNGDKVNGGKLRPLRISPGPPTLLAAHALPNLPYAGDWATDPRTGELVTVVAVDEVARVVRLRWDAATGVSAVDTEKVPTLPGNSAYGGIAVLNNGDITAIFNRATGPGAGPGTGRGPMTSALYRIPAGHPERAAKLADLGPVTSSDAATCPVNPHTIAARSVPPIPTFPISAPPQTAPPATPTPPATLAQPTTPAPTTPPPSRRPREARAPVRTPEPNTPKPARSRRHAPEPAPVAAAEIRHKIGERYIPVIGGLMVAAVAVSRLVRRGRR